MYKYPDIEKLLSRQAQQLLQQNGGELFDEYEKQTASIVSSKVSVSDPPQEYIKQPFCWIIEYLLAVKFSGQTPEYIAMIKDRYNNAISLLEENNHSSLNSSAAKAGSYSGLYSQEY